MNRKDLFKQILKKRSFLCIGLDSDIDKIPKHLIEEDPENAVFNFNKAIVDETHDLCVAYKPNLAFYESRGWKGFRDLERIVEYVKNLDSEILVIADVKKGDIGNTGNHQAKAFFETMECDAVTVAPYMGEDSIKPFLAYEDKWAILLALTSNKTSSDFQRILTVLGESDQAGYPLYSNVIVTAKGWESTTPDNLMYVVGATNASEEIKFIRDLVPDHFLLVPGIGAQGGSLEEVAKYGMNKQCGLLVNSSRGIIFAHSKDAYTGAPKDEFAECARSEAYKLQQQMSNLLKEAMLL